MSTTSTTLSTSLLDDLNPQQQKAVQATEGPVLILAGAGSGKTRVLTYRVAYLISEKKIPPENILCLTFTNKAAGEMMERIKKLLIPRLRSGQASHIDQSTPHPSTGSTMLTTSSLGTSFSPPTSQPVMGTFHSFCARILRREGKALGLPPGFAIYDEKDALDAIKEAMGSLNIPTQKTSPYSVRATISQAKNELISSLEYPQYARGFFQELVAKIYLEYQKILDNNHALDFDDLLLKTIQLFQTDTAILTRYQIQFKYILIDEYQDTNPAQYLISKYLANRHKNICVVGDAAQSIYSFRGADFRNIVNFEKDYPNAKIFNLEQNYRSTQNILDAATAVISKNKTHPILKLWTNQDGGEKIEVVETRNEVEEALFIISQLEKKRLSDYAILYRTNAQSRSLEEQFLRSGIPYKLVGGVSFYERKEIKDVLSYLRLLQNPKDSVSLKRAEKIGKGRLSKIMELAMSLRGVSETNDAAILPPKEGRITNQDSHARVPDDTVLGMTTLELLDKILQVTAYLAYLDDGTEIGKGRVENVKELRSVAEEFPNLVDFLENVALVENGYLPNQKKEAQDSVTLMTLHSAKGLEFPIVFMVGMEEGLFPHSRSMLDMNELEEERRLCYVGVTRAKQKLYLTYTRQRLYFGQRSNNLVSRFLSDIPEELVNTNISFKDSDDFDDDVTKDEEDWLNA